MSAWRSERENLRENKQASQPNVRFRGERNEDRTSDERGEPNKEKGCLFD